LGTVRVRALLPNRDERLKPGMLMQVVVRAQPATMPSAPEMAMVEEGKDVFVFRVAPKDGVEVAEKVKIATGRRVDGMVEILSGVTAGDRVVIEGVQRVRPGRPVRVSEASANAAPAAAADPARGRS
jgi:membrane fusion protein, multidrug efflux system